MHAAPMADSEGDFGDYKPYSGACRKCQGPNVRFRIWESSCGGYEDYNYRCFDCKHEWWVDGIDS